MTGFKLLLVFSLLTGVFAEQCEITAEDIASFEEKVTVTNASTAATAATVMISFDHSRIAWRIPPGQSLTASGLLATTYSISVVAPRSDGWTSYRQGLVEARDNLVALSVASDTSGTLVDVVVELDRIVKALAQLEEGDFFQSCSGKIDPGVAVHATVSSAEAPDGTGLWVLDCG